ncbi:MAG: K(+)-transporting ATPase subunit B [Candidatus Acididesulfobacter diazotrophicus]|jgi:K+-transporting ATPase ATPase B chain|uniref:Potassium-transporting ATPase ATP-binding subunit n=1 Tax=Candidatus Acididesulfobacter diazotrophicus TaxID=2597226 RepID=A0A519BNA1_9DELT|nr:MAG: K(+)-transporting ATPase subunit B [Candidatus Acididesulfobacter diazotrophicus]
MSNKAYYVSAFNKKILKTAIIESFRKLNPKAMIKNPVMFVVEIGSVITTAILFKNLFLHDFKYMLFIVQITLWLWFTVIFANFAESISEGRGKAQAETLRKSKTEVIARLLKTDGKEEKIKASMLRKGDIVVCETNDIIPGDGDVIEGIASVDESAITGESAPVIRESGGDRSAVTGGTKVLSDKITVKITSNPGEGFIDKMISLVEGASRQKTPNEIALNILLVMFTALFLVVVVTIEPMVAYFHGHISPVIYVALLVCLIPTTIGALLSAIGISGMDRLVKHNVIAMSGKAVEAAGDVNTLLLDKTGTITFGNRMAVSFIPAEEVNVNELADYAQLSSISDETPEGRSIVALAKKYGLRGRHLDENNIKFVPFSAMTRMSGVDILDKKENIRKGAVEAISNYVVQNNGAVDKKLIEAAANISKQGGTPLAVAVNSRMLGIIHLKDVVKGGIKERINSLRKIGIKTIMITGDNPLTAKAIADEAGVDEFVSEATPETKMTIIKKEQSLGKLVAMTGDGTNDAPALAQADVGVAMNTGTMAAKEAGNMIDLDSNPTKLIEIVETGKQLLITRGSLTTFSIANDLAKYFAIIPAMFAPIMPWLAPLNIMGLSSPQSAILSAVIFNAVIIIILIPLALRGVKYRPAKASNILTRNLLIYGLGGVIAPFIGIKLIDMLITYLHII